jgi:Family of unknown function (DUF5681)
MMKRAATSGSFKPGQSGNPSGRPKAAYDFRAICREKELPPWRRSRRRCGGAGAMQCGLPRSSWPIRGRPVQTMNVRKITCIADLTDDELRAIVGDDAAATSSGTRH